MNLERTDSFFSKLVNSQRLIYRFVRILLFLLFTALAVDNIRAGIDSLAPELCFRKDFLQDYLLAAATIAGEDPYQPVSVLEKNFLNLAGDQRVFAHPTPHPPTLIPYILWLPSLEYGVAASFWMILSFVLTGFSFYLLWSHFFKNKVKLSHVSFFLSLVLASQTFRSELIIGQFNGLLLFLLTCLMVYEKKGNDVLVGSFLGFCLSIKFFGAAFLIYYLFRGNIKVVVTSGLVFLASLGLSSLMISPQSVANYFTNVAPEVSKLYQADSFNISPLVLPQRIFGSDYPSAAEIAIEVDSLFSYPHLVEPLKYLLMAFLLLFSVFRANETRANNSRFGYLTVGSLAVLPNLWTHSLLVLIPFFALKFLGDDKPSLFHWLLLLLFFCGCYLPISIYSGERLSFWLGFATLTPSLIILLSIFTRDKISR